MSSEVFTWHPHSAIYTPEGECISARDSYAEGSLKPDALLNFFKLLSAGQAPFVKPDGTIAIGPKPALKNMFYSASGGSTNAPKLVCRSCKSWTLSFEENEKVLNHKQKNSYATFGSLSHSLTLYAALEALNTGADYHPLGSLKIDHQLTKIVREKINVLYATPTQLRLLGKAAKISAPLSSVLSVMIGGGWLDHQTKRRVEDLCPNAEIFQFYGAAETSFISMSNRCTPAGSVGQAYHDVKIKILNGSKQLVQTGELGEIWVKSPYLFSHYADPSKHYSEWKDGWLSIGEIGKLDGKGNLFLEGRKSRAFKIADQNIYPEKIEAALCQHPDISMAFVSDTPDKLRGAIAIAVIATTSGKLPTDIMKWSHNALGARSRPARFIYLSAGDWPLLPSGKPDIIALKAIIGEMI